MKGAIAMSFDEFRADAVNERKIGKQVFHDATRCG